MAWTEPQTKAIYQRGSNIIVSAGAGSGKTAVLSERILEFCKNGGDIRRVLVLTFTEAAAAEMKERIRKNLIKANLLDQAELIDSAYITTFDSYSLSIVKRYYYLLDLEQDISIMDGALISLKTEELVRELFTDYYKERNPRFFDYLRKYSLQDDKPVANTVVELLSDLELIVDLDSFINEYEATYFSEEKLNEIIDSYRNYASESMKEAVLEIKAFRDLAATDIASDKMVFELDTFLSHVNYDLSYEELRQVFYGYSLPRASKNMDPSLKDPKEALAKNLKSLMEKVFGKYITIGQMYDEIASTKDDVLFLLSMCTEVRDRLLSYKKSKNMFGFTDIAKLAIKLVSEYPAVNEELKNSYDEILVDEYQDTSDIQEAFLSQIENNNRYMVGDIKQSIYRFRNANPYIFKNKYESYSNNIGGVKIDLSHNFRSRNEVLANINTIFNELMTNEIGDADYKKSHQMIYGQKDYELLNQSIDFNMDILRYEPLEDSKFTQAEVEAFIIGKDIKDKIRANAKALRKEAFSDVTYNDFAILISSAKEFVTFKNVFEYLNIPVSIEAALDLKSSILPALYTNIIKAIALEMKKDYSKDYYHSLASISRSFIYEYSDEDIYKLVYKKEYLPIIDDIKKLAKTDELSYGSLFYKINNVMNIYDKLAKIGDVDSSIVVLEHVYNTFKLFDSVGYSLAEAGDYLDTLLASDLKMEYKPAKTADQAVRIMTIHKSKGLEYPYCYFPLLTQGFNQADMRKTIGLSHKYGIFIPFAEEGKSSTVIRTLYSDEVKKADISEKVRLLYVALTRAREKMIMVMPIRDKKSTSYKSFADMIEAFDTTKSFMKQIKLDEYNITDYKLAITPKYDFKGSKVLSYEEENPLEIIEKSNISMVMKSIPDKKTVELLKLGTEFHRALEVLDFKNPDFDNLPSSDRIKNTLKKLLSNEIFNNISNGKVFHEHEFYFTKDNEDYHGIIDLLIEYDNHIDLIDYKLSNTNKDEYKRQLSLYKDYINTKSDKPVNMYLLSILKDELTEVKI